MLSQIPPWVPVVFLLLLGLGLRQARTRRVAPAAMAGLALAMLGLSFYGVVAAYGVDALPLAAWALGIAAVLTWGRGLVAPRGLQPLAGGVQVPGSWLPLGLMMGLFAAKFALGVAHGIGSPVVHQAWFMGASSAVFGAFSGAFAARALAVRRCAARLS